MGANMSLMATSPTENGNPCLYVFGYGSLIWNPGFAFDQQYRAVARGYSRKFYQGNTVFRGTEEMVSTVDAHGYARAWRKRLAL